MKQFILIYIVCFILVYLGYSEGNFAKDLFVCGMSSLIFSFILYAIYSNIIDIINMTPIERNQYKLQSEIDKKKRNEKRALAKEIVQTVVIEEHVKTKVSWLDMSGRASIGHTLFGDVGAVAGALTTQPKIKPYKVKFLVIYADGHRKVEKVKYNSRRFKKLIMYI